MVSGFIEKRVIEITEDPDASQENQDWLRVPSRQRKEAEENEPSEKAKPKK